MYRAFWAMIVVPIFISLFCHKPSIDTFYKKFSHRSFSCLGLVLYQDVLIRNFSLEDLFFKCRERLVKGQYSLALGYPNFPLWLEILEPQSLLR